MQLTDVVVVPSKIVHVVPFVVHDRLVVEAFPPVMVAANEPIVVSTHWFDVQAHASPTPLEQGQSVDATLQPHTPETQAVPVVSPVQTLHVSPFFPHCVGSLVPVTHDPALQQPPLQSWVAEQLDVHVCVPVSHAVLVGQSVAELQPHAPATHMWPAVLLVQSMHVPPADPQLAGSVSLAHVPPLQQEPLQGSSAEQVVVHVSFAPASRVVSHA